MKWFKSFSDGKGGFDTFEWSLGDSIVSYLIGVLFMLLVIIVLLIVLPIILVFIHPYCSVKGMRITNVVSIVLSSLFLIDYTIGYRLWEAFNGTPYLISIHNDLAAIHVSLIIINLVLFVGAENVFNEIRPNLSNALWFSIIILAFVKIVLCHYVSDKVIENRATTPYITESSKN